MHYEHFVHIYDSIKLQSNCAVNIHMQMRHALIRMGKNVNLNSLQPKLQYYTLSLQSNTAQFSCDQRQQQHTVGST